MVADPPVRVGDTNEWNMSVTLTSTYLLDVGGKTDRQTGRLLQIPWLEKEG